MLISVFVLLMGWTVTYKMLYFLFALFLFFNSSAPSQYDKNYCVALTILLIPAQSHNGIFLNITCAAILYINFLIVKESYCRQDCFKTAG